MNRALVVLAAGIGRRFGGLKQMTPFGPNGEFIIDYSVFDALRAGFNKVVFLICKDIENDFRFTIGERVARHVDVQYAFQEMDDLPDMDTSVCAALAGRSRPWGTGHALLACRNVVQDPFAAINADDFYGRHSYEVLSTFLGDASADASLYSMVGFILRNTVSEHGHVSRGVCDVDGEGMLRKIVERTKIQKDGDEFSSLGDKRVVLDGDAVVSMNMWGLKPSVFSYLESEFKRFLTKYVCGPDVSEETRMRGLEMEFFLPSVVDRLIVDGKSTVRVLETSSVWFGVTYPEDREVVQRKILSLIDAGDYPANLWGSV